MSNQYPDAPGQRGPEDDAISPVLSALDGKLQRDGAQWRDTSSDPRQWFPDLRQGNAQSAGREDESTGLLTNHPATPSEPHDSQPRHAPHGPGRLPTVVGGGSALLVVALLALVLHGLAGTRTGVKKTSTAAPKVLQPATSWTTSKLVAKTDETLAIAQADPSVMYLSGISSGPSAQRSQDGGKTWHPLTLPTAALLPSDSMGPVLSISPLDAHTVFLTWTTAPTNPHCTPASATTGKVGGTLVASGGPVCFLQYISHDDGATWASATLPAKDSILSMSSLSYSLLGASENSTFVVHGTHLYAVMAPDTNVAPTVARRLVVSDDGGTTWRYADQGLAAAGRSVQYYQPDLQGSGAWAQTATLDGGTESEQAWRTDDGVTWHPVARPADCGPGSTCDPLGGAALANGTMVSYLFIDAPLPGQANAATAPYVPRVAVTSDGGKTWQTLPWKGIDAGMRFTSTIPGGMRADGTLVALFETVTTPHKAVEPQDYPVSAFFAWTPGAQAWQRLTPNLPAAQPAMAWITAGAGGTPTLYALSALAGPSPSDLLSSIALG